MSAVKKDPIYSTEQINIPPQLADILKNYTKFIIKTQPLNLNNMSAEYVNF